MRWRQAATAPGRRVSMPRRRVRFGGRDWERAWWLLAAAQAWYRRGAEAGHSPAMYNLAMLLQQRGELGEAETWYRQAAKAGDSRAMANLGALLHQRGELGEAETWYR